MKYSMNGNNYINTTSGVYTTYVNIKTIQYITTQKHYSSLKVIEDALKKISDVVVYGQLSKSPP